MKKIYLRFLFVMLSINTYSQDEASICYELFNSSSIFTELGTQAIALASESVWQASQLNGNQVTLFGTLAPAGNSWGYSATPTDKLVVQLPNGVKLEFKWAKFTGYIEGTWESFTKSHDIDLYAKLEGTLDFHIISKTYPDEEKKIHWQRNITGSVIYYSHNTTINLNHAGVSSSSVDNGFAEYQYQEQCTGSTSSSVLSSTVNDQYSSHIIHNSNSKQFVQNKEMLSNSTAKVNNDSYEFQNAHLRWASGTQFRDSAQAGIYNEAIDGNYWIAEGKMNKNNQHFGDVVFQMHASLPNYGPSLVLHKADGQNYLLHPILRRWMTVTDVKKTDNLIADGFELLQNYPNPFNPSTNIKFSLPERTFVNLRIYDALGREVTELVNEEKDAGNYEINFNAHNLSNGVYIYCLKTKEFVESRKMILMK